MGRIPQEEQMFLPAVAAGDTHSIFDRAIFIFLGGLAAWSLHYAPSELRSR
jgi:hypothetical protein